MKSTCVRTTAVVVFIAAVLFGMTAQATPCALPSDPATILNILFPLVDTNGDGGLSLTELSALYAGIPAQYFSIVDSNHDGKVSIAELTPFLSLIPGGSPLSLVDTNGNGAIEYAEVSQYVTPAQFALLDKDGNNVIDCADLGNVTPPAEGETPPPPPPPPPPPCPLPDDILPFLTNLLIPVFDTDQSGGLSLAEIQALYPIPAEYVSYFSIVDFNHNGQVDPDELVAIASALGVDLLGLIDTSGDRIIQYSEVAQYVSAGQFALLDRNGNGVFDCGDIDPVTPPAEGEPAEGELTPPVCALPADVVSVLAKMLIPLFDADQSGGLSLSEIQAVYPIPAEYASYFSLVDFNHNGQIEADEIVTAVSMLGVDPLGMIDTNSDRAIQYSEVSQYVTQSQFALLDRNGNGAFDCGDLTVISPEGEGETVLPCAVPNVNSLVLDAIFAIFDVNHDGGIAKEEVALLLPTIDASQLPLLFTMLGTDGNGRISRAALDALPNLLASLYASISGTSILGRIDGNGDGLIQLSEVSGYLDASLFATLDVNGNGVLDCEDLGALLQGHAAEGEPAEGEPELACPLPDIRPMLPRLALLLDTNHDGRVCKDEAGDFLTAFISIIPSAVAIDVFAMADQDGDGCLSAAELGLLASQLPNPITFIDSNGNGVLEQRELSMLLGPAEFAMADINHNGVIDCGDLAAIMALLGGNEGEPPVEGEPVTYCPVPADALFDIVVRLLDVNGDGGISLQEVQSVVPQVPAQVFTLGDTNGDGVIDPAELRALASTSIVQSLLPVTNPTPADILAAVDTNKDGGIEYSELGGFIPRDRFAVVDINNNGVIDCGDLTTTPPAEGEVGPAEGEPPAEGEGEITGLNELLTGLHGSRSLAGLIGDAFTLLDADGNNALSYEEIAARLQLPRGVFNAADTNGDGLVTLDELSALAQQSGGQPESVIDLVREVAGRFGNQFFAPGDVIRVTLRLIKHGDGVLNQLHLLEALPEGWTLRLVSGAAGVSAKSVPGNALVLDWSDATAFPLKVVYEATAPAGASGLVTVTGQADYQTADGTPQSTGAVASVLAEALPQDETHTADVNHDWHLSLSEVLRVVQLYNAGGYSAEADTEDGYVPGSGKQAGVPHDADYTGDWSIDISELLRVVQLFNAPGGAYYRASGTEDGFVPGLF